MNLDEYTDVKRNKVLVYGPPKSGKTVLVGRLAEAGFKLHWFDCEQGIKSLLVPENLKPEARKNISVYNIPDNRAYPIAIDVFRKLFKGGTYKFCYLHGVHQCPICLKDANAKWSEPIDLSKFTDKDVLCIDSWTQVAESAANKVTLKAWQKDDEYKMDFDDFRMQGMYQTEVLSKIQVANINICVISHEIDVEKDDKKQRVVPTAGTRNYSQTVAKYFDECIHIQAMNGKHTAHSSTTWINTHLTGGRSGIKLEASTNEKPIGLADIFRAGLQSKA